MSSVMWRPAPGGRGGEHAAYLHALDEGRSVLIRPRAAYPGLDAVRALFLRLAGQATETDLAGLAQPIGTSGPDERAWVALHTSGSTGSPTCVVYSRDVVLAHAKMVATTLGLDSARTYLSAAPPAFAYGLSVVTSHHLAGVPVRHLPAPLTAGALRDALGDSPGDVVLYLLPQQAVLLAEVGALLDRVGTVIVAGGRLSGMVAAIARAHPTIELVNMYGQAEHGPRLALWRGPLADYAEGTIGGPVPGVEIELGPADDLGRTELLVRTPYAMSWSAAAPYRELTPGPEPGAMIRTGDYGALVDGRLVHRGRSGRFANVAGTKIDLQDLGALVESTVATAAIRVAARPALASGDDVVEIQLVPTTGATLASTAVRRALHPTLGSLVGLLDIRVVDQLELSEAAK